MKNRAAWGLVGVLSVLVVGGSAVLGKTYWVARYRGSGADLRGAFLLFAPLRGADLRYADLQGATLRGADLRSAQLDEANLADADLRGARMQRANLFCATLTGTNLNSVDLTVTSLYGARFDWKTQWQPGYDSTKNGALRLYREEELK